MSDDPEVRIHVLEHELHIARDALDWTMRERDEARAEVQRLREDAGKDGWKGRAHAFQVDALKAEVERDRLRKLVERLVTERCGTDGHRQAVMDGVEALAREDE